MVGGGQAPRGGHRRGWLARAIILASSFLVPREERDAWCEEWHAELDTRLIEGEAGLLRRASGAPLDAWLMRRRGVRMTGLGKDVRWAVRALLRTPSFTLTAVCTLGLGAGAITALFSVVNGVLRQPLPYPEPDRLVRVEGAGSTGFRLQVSRPDWRDWNEAQTSFTGIASYLPLTTETALGGSQPARFRVRRVSANFFDVLGVSALRGRTFGEGESGRSPTAAAVLSWGAWQRLYGGRSDLGTLRLDVLGEAHTVIGVMPRDFEFVEPTDVWVLHEREAVWEVRFWPTFGAFARLRPGSTMAMAAADMNVVAGQGRKTWGDRTMAVSVVLSPLRESMVAAVRGTLLTLFAAAGFVMLVACANVASALLARGLARAGDLAVRRAVGATRGRLVRELLIESAMLALAGGTAGMVVARAGLAVVRVTGSGLVPRLDDVRLAGGVALFALLVSGMATILFGLAPAFASSSVRSISSTIRSIGRGRRTAWSGLVAVEVAAATSLLVGTGLLVRSVMAIRGESLGWNTRDAYVVEVSLPPSLYADGPSRIRFERRLHSELASVPGVTAVGATTRLPLEPSQDGAPAYTPETGWDNAVYSGFRVVDPTYFEAMGIPLIEGRTFDASDTQDMPDVAIVTESMARKLWPGEDPIGKRVRHNHDLGNRNEWLTVVGVSGDVRHWALEAGGQHELYTPYTQRGEQSSTMMYIVRAADGARGIASAVHDRAARIDPQVPVSIRTMDDRLAVTYRNRTFALVLLGAFAAVAAILALIGTAGVVSYAVERRRREIGIRVALGARPARLLLGTQASALGPAIAGTAVGMLAALFLARAISSLLWGVTTSDPITQAGVALMLVLAVSVASAVPALRTLRVQPADVMRNEG